MSVFNEQRAGWMISVKHKKIQRRVDIVIQENQQN